VGSRADADEVARETWLAVLRGLDRFEGHATPETQTSHILVSRAKTRVARTRRCIPLSAFDGPNEPFGPAVGPPFDSWPPGAACRCPGLRSLSHFPCRRE
jgi:RNA polymerase sigma-70 factor, ECF subfamily